MNIILCVLLFASPLLAQDFTFDKESGKAIPKHIAELKDFRGDVFKEKSGNLVPIKKGARFYKEDHIVTMEKSFAKIQMVDDSVINLSENTAMSFSHFKFVDKNDREGVFDILKGQIRALVRNKAKKDALKFKTKFAVMAVRGTELLINVHTQQTKEIAEFALNEGAAHLSHEQELNLDMKRPDRIVIVHDSASGKSAYENRPLTADELKLLEADEKFLPLFNPAVLQKESPLYSFFTATDVKEMKIETASPATSERPEEDSKWQKNLQKLNEKLKDYQKKR